MQKHCCSLKFKEIFSGTVVDKLDSRLLFFIRNIIKRSSFYVADLK